MHQNWYKSHPYGVYPLGNMISVEQMKNRFGTLSRLSQVGISDENDTELPFLELMQLLLSFVDVKGLCHLSGTCSGFYVMVHCSDAFKCAYTFLSPKYLSYYRTWKETAIRGYLRHHPLTRIAIQEESSPVKRRRVVDRSNSLCTSVSDFVKPHCPIQLSRPYFSDHFFQAWMCALLPPTYHLFPIIAGSPSPSRSEKVSSSLTVVDEKSGDTFQQHSSFSMQQYKSKFKVVERRSKLSPDEFHETFEKANIPVVLTDIATEWPIFKILSGNFKNLSLKKNLLMRPGSSINTAFRCEHTSMSLDDYVRYATEQTDERPIYLFDAEFGDILDLENLYTVPEHFGRDDFFSVLGPEGRPRYRWLIAGPTRAGSSFHVDPNYTSAWNANLTGRKRWLLFPPGAIPPGVVPSRDMSEVATPLSLTEWLLNYYDAAEKQLGSVGYECVCEPGEIMFIPSGWWHYVINLEDSVAITQNYVSRCNLLSVLKFLRYMKGSISGINEDADGTSEDSIRKRREFFAEEFAAAMEKFYPDIIHTVQNALDQEQEQLKQKQMHRLGLLEKSGDGFRFDFS